MVNLLSVADIKVFVPAKDFKLSLSFYEELGWKTVGLYGNLAELELGGVRFFLQDHYNRGWANNFMLYINVANTQAWYDHLSEVLKNGKYGKARVNEPKLQPHGDIVTHAWDPSGVLLHFAQRTDQ